MRITGQLIDTASGAHIWADRFDGALDDIFELQDQIASGVVGAIEPRLRLAEIERAAHKPTENLDAYDLYLGALASFHKMTPPGIGEAVRLLRQALEIDPSCAAAAGLIAWCWTFESAQGWITPTPALRLEASRIAKQAIDVGKDYADALWMAGHTIAQWVGDHAAGLNAIDRALALNPNSANAWTVRGWVNVFAERLEAAIEAFERSIRLSPLAAPRAICGSWGRCSRQTLPLCRRVRFVDRPLRAMDRVRVQELHRHAPALRAAEHLLEHPLQVP